MKISLIEKINVIYDECQSGLLAYRFFEVLFGKQIYEVDTTSLAPPGAKDSTLKAEMEISMGKSYIFITGDKDFAANLSFQGLTICFGNNNYTLKEKHSILNRLFKTKGFKFRDISDLLKRYTTIFVNRTKARCLLRKNNIWKTIPLYERYCV